MSMLPKIVQLATAFNPMFYLVNGMRYAVTGFSDVSVMTCMAFSFMLAVCFFLATVYLFKIGYKLRT